MKEADSKEKTSVSKREEEVRKFWEDNDIFKKSEGRGDDPFVFYDGPPFANGEPHYGHMLASTIKDAIPRYQVMNGRKLRRRWGWDCHGLPVENLTEKELGLKGKKDIEEYGVEKFNEATRVNIMRDAQIWEERIPRLGRFVDMKDDYKTMDPSYTESVWWAFKTLYDKDLIYKGFKSMHLCPRCGTTLSNFEVNLGYKDITDIAITVPFELVDEPSTYILAWTTTPWTLPGNMALAVNSEIEYVKISKKSDTDKLYILAKDRLPTLSEEYEVKGEFKGDELIGKKYKPLFHYYEKIDFPNKDNAWKIYAGDFVTTTDGVGVVHIAPAFGEDDLKLAGKNNIPIIHHVGFDGKFKKEIDDFDGLYVKPKDDKEKGIDHTDTDVEVIKFLARSGKLFAKEKITHSYPLCWRCDTPLLNYATDSWFVKVTDIKDKLVEENNKIHWVPESIGKYRFGNWLEGAHDWAISRSRYWGAPIPVWENKDKTKRIVLGSIEDWRKYAKKSGNKYFVMRHGEAESNVGNFTSSSYKDKVHLTEKGKTQIEETIKSLSDKKIDFIIASDFLRTKETAELVMKGLGLEEDSLIFDKRLREIDTGDFAGKSNGEYHAYFSSLEEKFTKPAPNGESLLDLKRRVMEFLYEIEEKYKDKNILIVTHEYAVWMIFTGSMGWSIKKSAKEKEEKDDFIKTAEVMDLPFVPLPYNREYELDFHKPYIDEVKIVNEGEEYTRVPDVFDCWFESGSMPFAQDHYPFEKDNFDGEKRLGYPADFIAEGLDQTRGWFYSLLVLGVALFDKAPYKNVIVNGLVLAEDGQKMSKRLKNYPDPMEVIEKYGADAVRVYMLSSPIVRGEELRFSEKGVAEVANKTLGRLLNVYTFLEMYGEIDKNISYETLKEKAIQSNTVLDRWMLLRLKELEAGITTGMNKYEFDSALRGLPLFVDDFSTWYLRRGRERLKGDNKEDRDKIVSVLRFIVLETSKLIAPFAPFIAEHLFLNVRTQDLSMSVHLEQWSHLNELKVNAEGENILQKMNEARKVVSSALLLRSKLQIKVRQPLKSVTVKNQIQLDVEYISLIKDELNVKEVNFDPGIEGEIVLDTNITEELKEEGLVREIIREIQDERKNLNLSPEDKVDVTLHLSSNNFNLEKYKNEIARVTGARTFSIGSGELGGNREISVSVSKI